jgi:hypothetical protein
MSVNFKGNLGVGGAGAPDQSTKVMQQQIADLERQLAHVNESLEAMAQLSQALATRLSSQGKQLPTVQKVPTGSGKFKLVLRP